MKKILLSLILLSSLAMSGDIGKCSEAERMNNKYTALYDDAITGNADKKTQEAYKAIAKAWAKQGHKECEGILNKEQLEWFFGKQ